MSRRNERVNELLREQLSELIQRQLKDPRLNQLITITEVVTSVDMRYAKVYVSIMAPTDEERDTAMEGLNAATGYLHRELTRRLDMRSVPEVTFIYDDSLERGAYLTKLINEVSQENKS
ncbi:MAG: 30S ribosome-binding factor RbfA [Dehalococcoidia bacterium]|nr:30S ribosome-binding factor RbfA [Dehalococcoidia bacterium]